MTFKTKKTDTSHAGRWFCTRTCGWSTAHATTATTKAPNHHHASRAPTNITTSSAARNDHRITALEPTNPPRRSCCATGTGKARASSVDRNSVKFRKRNSSTTPAMVTAT